MQKIAKKTLLLVLLALSLAAHSEPATKASVKVLMQATGAGEMGMAIMEQMLPALKQMIPEAPESFWTDTMSATNSDKWEDMVIPVYQKYLTEEDIQALNKFYQSPVGQKLIQVQPAIIQESLSIGQQWGQNTAKQILRQYQQQAVENKPNNTDF